MLRVELSGLHGETRLSSQGIEAGVGLLVERVRCAELEPPEDVGETGLPYGSAGGAWGDLAKVLRHRFAGSRDYTGVGVGANQVGW